MAKNKKFYPLIPPKTHPTHTDHWSHKLAFQDCRFRFLVRPYQIGAYLWRRHSIGIGEMDLLRKISGVDSHY